jgi:hypothetical protein
MSKLFLSGQYNSVKMNSDDFSLDLHRFEKAIACSLECLSRSSKLPLIDKFTAIESCQMLYECFRKMYVQSTFIYHSPNEAHFLSAVQYAKLAIVESGNVLDLVALFHADLARLYSLKALQLFFEIIAKTSPSAELLHQLILDYSSRAKTSNSTLTSTIQSSNANAYLTTRKEVLFHGQRAANLSAEFLYGMKDHTESWIIMLEKQKHVYRLLQEHHILTYHVILHSLNGKAPINFTDTQMSALLERSIGAALLWAERERTRALLFQLGSNKLSTLATKQLFEFDCNDEIAWKALKSSQAACGARTVILEYSCSAILVEEIPCLDECNCWLIYAMNDLVCSLLLFTESFHCSCK